MSQSQDSQPSSETAEMLNPGEQLKQTREGLELSVADVAARLKLNAHKIDALERGDVENIESPVFVAGYLRSYARLLGLSEEAVLSDFSALSALVLPDAETMPVEQVSGSLGQNLGEIPASLPPQSADGQSGKPSALLMTGLIGLVLAAVIYFVLVGDKATEDLSNIASAVMEKSVEEEMPMPGMEAGIELDLASDAVSGSLLVDEDPVQDINALSQPVSAAENETEAETNQSEMLAVIAQSELALFFSDDSWVEVEDARGERLIYRLVKAGMARTVMGVPPFDVQLGYVPGVEIMYNGAAYDLSRFAGRRSARFSVGSAGEKKPDE